MEFKHTSVLFEECMEGLKIRPDGIYADGTLGGGGHSSGICSRLGENGTLIGIDRDTDALKAAEERLKGNRKVGWCIVGSGSLFLPAGQP